MREKATYENKKIVHVRVYFLFSIEEPVNNYVRMRNVITFKAVAKKGTLYSTTLDNGIENHL